MRPVVVKILNTMRQSRGIVTRLDNLTSGGKQADGMAAATHTARPSLRGRQHKTAVATSQTRSFQPHHASEPAVTCPSYLLHTVLGRAGSNLLPTPFLLSESGGCKTYNWASPSSHQHSHGGVKCAFKPLLLQQSV